MISSTTIHVQEEDEMTIEWLYVPKNGNNYRTTALRLSTNINLLLGETLTKTKKLRDLLNTFILKTEMEGALNDMNNRLDKEPIPGELIDKVTPDFISIMMNEHFSEEHDGK